MLDAETKAALRRLGVSEKDIEKLSLAQGDKAVGNWPVKHKQYGAKHWRMVTKALVLLLEGAISHVADDKLRGSIRHAINQVNVYLEADNAAPRRESVSDTDATERRIGKIVQNTLAHARFIVAVASASEQVTARKKSRRKQRVKNLFTSRAR